MAAPPKNGRGGLWMVGAGLWINSVAAGPPVPANLSPNPSFERSLALKEMHGLTSPSSSASYPPSWTTLFDPFAEAQELLRQWRFQEALVLFERVDSQADPSAGLASLGRALCLLHQHREEEAKAAFREIAEGDDVAARYAHFWWARMALEEGQVAGVEEALIRLLESSRPSDWVFPLLERWATAVAGTGEVLDHVEEAPEWQPWVSLVAPFLAEEEERPQRIKERLEEAGLGAREQAVLWAWCARQEEGWMPAEAAADWQRAWEIAQREGPLFLTAARALGLQALQAGEFEGATDWLEFYFAEAGKAGWAPGPWEEEVDLRYRFAEGLYQSKRWEAALGHYRAVLLEIPGDDPRYLVARLHQGVSAKELRLWLEAEEALREVIGHTWDPRLRVYAALRCAEVEAAQGQTEGGIGLLDEVSAGEDLTGEQVGQLQLKAAFYEHEAQAYGRAGERCERFLREHPEEPGLCASALLRLAYSYEYQGQLDQAGAAFRRVIEEYEEFPEQVRAAKADLAFAVLARQGQWQEAIGATREVLADLAPTDPLAVTLQYRLGHFYAQAGDDQQALEELAKVPPGQRGGDPHLDVRLWQPYTQAACLLRLGRLAEAKQVLTRALEAQSAVILQGALQEAEAWEKQPLRDAPERVWLELPHPGGAAQAEVRLRAYGRTPLEVQTTQGWLRVRVPEEVETSPDLYAGVERTVILEVTAGPGQGDYADTLTVRSPQHAGIQLEIPVQLHVPGWIQADPPEVFWGFVEPGKVKTMTVTLTSEREFRVQQVQAPSAAWQAEAAPVGTGRTWELRVTLSTEGLAAGQILEGDLLLETDVPGEQQVHLSCYAHIPSLPSPPGTGRNQAH